MPISSGPPSSKTYYVRLCGRLGHRSQKMVLGTSLPGFNPEKLPFFVTILSRGQHDSTNFTEKVFSKKSEHTKP
jgi:hypothetical protein